MSPQVQVQKRHKFILGPILAGDKSSFFKDGYNEATATFIIKAIIINFERPCYNILLYNVTSECSLTLIVNLIFLHI